jgi:uncharacterized membrane protein YcgQ (UPF0703/DUF1980 family)
MKKNFKKFIICLLVASLFCTSIASAKSTKIIELTDKFYVTYINDIFYNQDDYLGKTLRLQGAYMKATYNLGNSKKKQIDFVYRNGPGCCGNDGAMCGFEFENTNKVALKDDDWIEVTGVLETYEENGLSFLRLANCTVTVMKKRGNINVYN